MSKYMFHYSKDNTSGARLEVGLRVMGWVETMDNFK